jgi:hypothetical protein
MRRLAGLRGMVTRASAFPVQGAVAPLHASLCAAVATSGRSTAAEATVAARGRCALTSDASTSGRGGGREGTDDGVGNFVSRLRADVLALWRGAEMMEAFLGKGLHGPKLLKMLRMLAESEAGQDGRDDQQTLKVTRGICRPTHQSQAARRPERLSVARLRVNGHIKGPIKGYADKGSTDISKGFTK